MTFYSIICVSLGVDFLLWFAWFRFKFIAYILFRKSWVKKAVINFRVAEMVLNVIVNVFITLLLISSLFGRKRRILDLATDNR